MNEGRRSTAGPRDANGLWFASRSIGVGADDLAAVTGRERLIDADLTSRDDAPEAGRRLHASYTGGHAGARVEGPGVDGILQELDRAVHEGEVGAAGMEARSRGHIRVAAAGRPEVV